MNYSLNPFSSPQNQPIAQSTEPAVNVSPMTNVTNASNPATTNGHVTPINAAQSAQVAFEAQVTSATTKATQAAIGAVMGQVMGDAQSKVSALTETINQTIGKVIEMTSDAQTNITRAQSAAEASLAKIAESAIARAQANSQILSISINQEPARSLTREAHPKLADLMKLARVAQPDVFPWLCGPAGSGKSELCAQVAEALGLSFAFINMSIGVSETWLYGRQTPTGFVDGGLTDKFANGGVFLIDEISRGDSNLLTGMNAILSGSRTFRNPISNQVLSRHPDFILMAADNTVGKGPDAVYTSTTRLDGSTLDRAVYFPMDYLARIEASILADESWCELLRNVRAKLQERRSEEIISYRAFAKVSKLQAIGYSPSEIIATLTASWPKGLAQEVGFVADKLSKTKPAQEPQVIIDDPIIDKSQIYKNSLNTPTYNPFVALSQMVNAPSVPAYPSKMQQLATMMTGEPPTGAIANHKHMPIPTPQRVRGVEMSDEEKQEVKNMFTKLLANPTQPYNYFVRSLQDWFTKHGTLSQKQYAALKKIYKTGKAE